MISSPTRHSPLRTFVLFVLLVLLVVVTLLSWPSPARSAGWIVVKLTDNAVDDRNARVNGDWVVWDRDNEIRLRNVATGYEVQLTSNSIQDYAPAVSRSRVAWIQNSASWLLAANVSSPPDISGPRVVWTQSEGGDEEIYLASYWVFTDVPWNHRNHFAIQSLADENVAEGYPDGTFRPVNNVWRAQFAKMIVGALNLYVKEDLVPPSPFSDLGPDDPSDLYPHEYVAAAAAANITNGTTPTTFSPWNNISRAQVVTMVVRAAQNLLGASTLIVPPPGWAGTFGNFDATHTETMRIAEYNHLLEDVAGFGPGWSPWTAASRAEVAQIIYNLMEIAGLM